MKMMKSLLPAAIAVAFSLTSCGETNNAETSQEKKVTTNEPAEKKTETESVSDTVHLEIQGTDQMEYNKDRLRAKAGQIVVLTLKHVGEMPESAMGHNWVLLKKGADVAAFAQDAVNAKENDYIPEGRTEDIIAHTEMLGGGESATITFEAPRKGIYDYLCSFPGHFMKMKGKFIVE